MKKIHLSGKRGTGKYAIVDDDDYDRLAACKWQLSARGYAAARNQIQMHRKVMAAPRGTLVDHINGDKLDNRKANLRLATNQQNLWNRSKPNRYGYYGVHPPRTRKEGWRYIIKNGDRQEYRAGFETARDACLAYNARALELRGEFAKLNEVSGH